jgi:hypothetical protein
MTPLSQDSFVKNMQEKSVQLKVSGKEKIKNIWINHRKKTIFGFSLKKAY